MYYPHDNGQNCAYPLGHRVLAFAHDGVINASLLKCSGCKKTSSFLPQYINHHSACVRQAPRAFCFERHWAIGRESAPIPSVGIGTPHRHTSTLALVKFYPLRFSRLMRSHMGMKGAPDAPRRTTFHLCLLSREYMGSSFADFQLNRVCRFQGKLPWVKARASQTSARANRYMSCVLSNSSRVLVEPNEWCGTTHPRHSRSPRLAGVGSRHKF